MKLIPTTIARGCARPFKAAARIFRNYVIPPVKAARSRLASAALFVWRPMKAVTFFMARVILRFVLKPISRFLLKPIWNWRRPLIGLASIATGLGIIYGGYYVVLPMQSPQKIWYNKGMEDIRKDFANHNAWSAFKSPEIPNFQRSILYFNNQAEAGLLDRLLYGAPDVELASQAYLKLGVISLYNANDEKLVREAKDYLEKAVLLNPGILYARELLADISAVDRLAVLALAPERNLEMLYNKHPEARSKKPDKSKEGKGDESKDPQEGDQKGQPDQPNDEPGKDDQKQGEEAPASKNDSLQQNMQDVKNGVGNDGI